MLFLIILPILVSGYILFTKHPKHQYNLHRYDGQLLYLRSAYYGVIVTIISFFSLSILKTLTPNVISIPIDKWVNDLIFEIAKENSVNITWILLGSINAIIISHIMVLYLKLKLKIKTVGLKNICKNIRETIIVLHETSEWPKKDKPVLSIKIRSEILLMSTHLKYSPMLMLYLESFITGNPIMFTMSDRKVYVGKIISLGEQTETTGLDQEITITPFLSGYRDKDTLKVIFNTSYTEIAEDIHLTIKQENISTATKYIQKVYDQFKSIEENKKPV